MVDLGSLVLLMSIFGPKVALMYVIVGLLIAIIGGSIIERLNMDDQVADFIKQAKATSVESESLDQRERVQYAFEQTQETLSLIHI